MDDYALTIADLIVTIFKNAPELNEDYLTVIRGIEKDEIQTKINPDQT